VVLRKAIKEEILEGTVEEKRKKKKEEE